MDPRHYVDLGRQAIMEILDREHAAVWLEIEAKAADQPWGSLPTRVDPHALTTARKELRALGLIDESLGTTRGGREIAVLHLADLRGRRDAFSKAAARKRLLQARYLGWAVGSHAKPNLIGQAGERVVHESLKEAAPYGYLLVRPEGGDVEELFGHPVPGGSLDNAAFLQLLDGSGVPHGAVATPIEVKNTRGWIYPDTSELHQLLYKSARLQEEQANLSFLPLLVCRRAHKTTFYMARDLGFMVIDLWRQFILPKASVRPHHLEEIRRELGYLDLVPHDQASEPLVRRLRRTVPRQASSYAERWRRATPVIVPLVEQLRDESISASVRRNTMNGLRTLARSLPETFGGW